MKKGDFVLVKETAYRHIEYEGVITEVFKDVIQIFGCGYRPIGFHEFNRKEIKVKKIEKEKVKFSLNQEIRKMEGKRFRTETALNDLAQEINETTANFNEIFK